MKDTNYISDIIEFIEKFKFKEKYDSDRNSSIIFRASMIREEIDELEDAIDSDDKVGIIDALVDIVYFALGTAVLEKYNFNEHWNAVHAANMKKVLGIKKGREHVSDGLDVIKPEGWIDPKVLHEEIIRKN